VHCGLCQGVSLQYGTSNTVCKAHHIRCIHLVIWKPLWQSGTMGQWEVAGWSTWGWTPCLPTCRGDTAPKVDGLHYGIYRVVRLRVYCPHAWTQKRERQFHSGFVASKAKCCKHILQYDVKLKRRLVVVSNWANGPRGSSF